jgi:hypothetical protein
MRVPIPFLLLGVDKLFLDCAMPYPSAYIPNCIEITAYKLSSEMVGKFHTRWGGRASRHKLETVGCGPQLTTMKTADSAK